ncbi:dUTP diphosphatase [Fictibacillus sp. Mic-4]|uniref:dUTP diphosphatase n=1 Tax=Fictibacillus sp. Mic-4 TaxID=3132826 RepID=UPI003CF527CE
MNLKKLFEMQQELDDHIIKEHGLEGQNLLPDKNLALQVELGELANEWRRFKFWSHNREPRLKELDRQASRIDKTVYKNPLLEEYVDCIHFTLSIGLELYIENGDLYIDDLCRGIALEKRVNVHEQFSYLFFLSSGILSGKWQRFINALLGLGEMLGFSWEQIEAAYMKKNAVNHRRQESGY